MGLHAPYDSYEENRFALFFSNYSCYWGSQYLQILKYLIAFNCCISCILHTSNPFCASEMDFQLALFYFIFFYFLLLVLQKPHFATWLPWFACKVTSTAAGYLSSAWLNTVNTETWESSLKEAILRKPVFPSSALTAACATWREHLEGYGSQTGTLGACLCDFFFSYTFLYFQAVSPPITQTIRGLP